MEFLSFCSLKFFRFFVRMLAFISCATFCPHSFLPFQMPKTFIVVLWLIFLSSEPSSGHKTDPEERSVPILAWICSILLVRSILGKITVNLLPMPEFLHRWSLWGTSFLLLFTSLKQLLAGRETFLFLLFEIARTKYLENKLDMNCILLWLLDFQNVYEPPFLFLFSPLF